MSFSDGVSRREEFVLKFHLTLMGLMLSIFCLNHGPELKDNDLTITYNTAH